MSLEDDVNLEEFIMAKDELTGADIKVSYYILKFTRQLLLKLDY